MGSLLEMTANIVSSHASKTEMNGDDLLQELQKVYVSLQHLEEEVTGEHIATGKVPKIPAAMTLKKAFRKDQIYCMICGKGEMKTLTRHLSRIHDLKPGAYRKQFGIPTTQALTASDFSEARRKMARDRGLADNLTRARAVRAEKTLVRKAAAQRPAKAAKGKAPRAKAI